MDLRSIGERFKGKINEDSFELSKKNSNGLHAPDSFKPRHNKVEIDFKLIAESSVKFKNAKLAIKSAILEIYRYAELIKNYKVKLYLLKRF